MLLFPNANFRYSILSSPLSISHGVDQTDLLSRFVWDGCRDYTAALALPAVLDFWEDRRQDVVIAAMKTQLIEGVECLVNHWHDSSCSKDDWMLAGVTMVPTCLISPMALVRLPSNISGNQFNKKTSDHAKNIQDFLFDNNVEVPIKCINGELFVRLSCHVYNELEDFDCLGKVLLKYPGK